MITNPPDAPMPNRRMRLKKILGYIPALIILPILIWILIKNLGTLSAENIQPNPWLILLSLTMLPLHFTLSGLGWGLLLYFLGSPIGAYQAVRISALSLLGRYIPGKIWVILAKVYLAGRLGVSRGLALTASGYDFLFFNLGALSLLCLIMIANPSQSPWGRSVFLVLLPAIGLVILFPNLITIAVNIALKLIKRQPLSAQIGRSAALATLVFYTFAWTVTISSFSLFVKAFFPHVPIIPLSASLITANLIGFAFFFAPAGLGVREGVMAFVLKSSGLPAGEAVLIALLCRVWSTAGEILVVGPLWLYKGKADLKSGPTEID